MASCVFYFFILFIFYDFISKNRNTLISYRVSVFLVSYYILQHRLYGFVICRGYKWQSNAFFSAQAHRIPHNLL